MFFRVIKVDGACRAVFLAGTTLSLCEVDALACVNAVLQWYGLGIRDVDCLAFNNFLVVKVIDFFRIGGEYDYLLKIITRDMESYDEIYRRLIDKVELETVTSYFAMEAIEEQRPIPLG